MATEGRVRVYGAWVTNREQHAQQGTACPAVHGLRAPWRSGQLRAQVGMGLEVGQSHKGLWIPMRRCGCDQALSLASDVKESQRDQPSSWELRLGASSRRRD